ncbi:MFS transporter [Arthrobacter tumbae]|uniref:MFS transporter n=1 Tax=Arthrobacter tumbae TaxID=163874 RepID=UPI00195C9E10|nr:MFS transporter [Arthrobacter tumbae]MBM7782312.1 MFS family permease [Arthrobacter tumbae]
MNSSRPGRRATGIAALTTVVAVLPAFLVGGLAVQLEGDLGMSAAALGICVASFWGMSALLSAPAGFVATSLGFRNGMLITVGLGLTAMLGIAAFTPHWPLLILWLSIAGAANALSHPLSNGLIVSQVGTHNRAFAFGLKQAAIPSATLAAGVSVPLFALTIGWQWTFVATALLAAAMVPVLLRVLPRKAPSTPKAARTPRKPLPKRLRPFLLATAVAGALGSGQANVVGAFTVASAVETGFNPAAAGLLLGAASAAGVLARPLVGMLADRGIGGSMATVAMMIGGGCLGLVGMASGHPVAYGVGAGVAFGLGWGWNGLVHYVVSHTAHPFTAQATGVIQTGTYVGGTVAPLVFGLLFATYDDSIGWSIAAVVAAAGAIAAAVAFRLERGLRAGP